MMEHPYRAAPSSARWVCIACYRSLSTLAGRCPNCHVDRLDLMRSDVRDEVRKHAEKLLQRRMMREEMILGTFSILAGILITGSQWIGILIGLGLRMLLVRAYVKLRPRGALAVYAARRRRLALTTGIDTRSLAGDAIETSGGDAADDPEIADLDELLRGLGAKLED
jgi:hypothetical protein